ncbi:MAG: S26 family signal peptidase [Thermoplasmata archaeon]|nr:S26 family signal peptidase [Thermoplasmata archaeon]
MDKKKLKKNMGEITRDIMVAFLIIAVIMLSLYSYCGIWPPMVVIESGSMEHPPSMTEHRSYVGVIDTGDMVFVKKVNASYGEDVLTYYQGEEMGHSTYGSYGDVVIYRPNGQKYRGNGDPVIPIIHRLVIWLEINTTHVNPNFNGIDYANYSFDVPSLEIYDSTAWFNITNYGYRQDTVTINLGRVLRYYEAGGIIPHSGYITKGDNNPNHDQDSWYEPVLPEWIIGKAWGELPWFGLIKLWVNGADTSRAPSNSWTGLFGTIIILLVIPLIWDYIIPKTRKFLGKRKNTETEEPITGLDEQTPEEIDPGKDENTVNEEVSEEPDLEPPSSTTTSMETEELPEMDLPSEPIVPEKE